MPPKKQKRAEVDVLGTILNGVAETSAKLKHGQQVISDLSASNYTSPKLPNQAVAFDRYVQMFLDSIRPKALELKNEMDATIEIEMRLGRLCAKKNNSAQLSERFDSVDHEPTVRVISEEEARIGMTFRPGVQRSDFAAFQNTFKKLADATSTEKTCIMSYPDNMRVMETSSKSFKSQCKMRIGCVNIFLPHCPYDVRLSVSVETPWIDVAQPETQPQSRRTRNREKFEGSKFFGFEIDSTYVRTESANGADEDNSPETFEMEMELTVAQCDVWASGAPNSSLILANSMWRCLSISMPSVLEVVRVDADDSTRSLVQSVLARALNRNTSSKFPGTMPVGFGRRFFGDICDPNQNYHVSEKTDGTRYFLVLLPGNNDCVDEYQLNIRRHPILIDRTNAFFTLPGLSGLTAVLPTDSVLDGELVMNRRENRPYFIFFDIISIGGKVVSNHAFTERLKEMQTLAAHVDQRMIAEPNLIKVALPLLRKTWFPAKNIREIFSRIKTKEISHGSFCCRTYLDEKKRCHHTDGVVFSPNTTYVCDTHHKYFKWKWLDQITVDLLVRIDSLSLMAAGRGEDIDLSSQIILSDSAIEMIREASRSKSGIDVVAELGFDRESGKWNCKTIRYDKRKGNFITTVVDALTQLAESIDEAELIEKLTGSRSNNSSAPPVPVAVAPRSTGPPLPQF
eukprot:c7104_g1_i1.p1 GENE.c7104_g1_i1~~c7104_g1_i1.p1  ORF type:complete len:682 (-),score=149.77 c7104_g1_i1:20-2065(-)